jgi:hypothetical protein
MSVSCAPAGSVGSGRSRGRDVSSTHRGRRVSSSGRRCSRRGAGQCSWAGALVYAANGAIGSRRERGFVVEAWPWSRIMEGSVLELPPVCAARQRWRGVLTPGFLGRPCSRVCLRRRRGWSCVRALLPPTSRPERDRRGCRRLALADRVWAWGRRHYCVPGRSLVCSCCRRPVGLVHLVRRAEWTCSRGSSTCTGAGLRRVDAGSWWRRAQMCFVGRGLLAESVRRPCRWVDRQRLLWWLVDKGVAKLQ